MVSQLEEMMMISTVTVQIAEAVVAEVVVVVVIASLLIVVLNVADVEDAREENLLSTTKSSQLFELMRPASQASFKVRVKYLSPSAAL